MRRSLVLIAVAGALTVAAGSASAQSWRGYNTGYHSGQSAAVRAQMDRPGDYRCDVYWDANRTDCGAGWRDQRHRTSWNAGYGHRYDDRRHYGYGHGYRSYRGYGSAYAAQASQGTAYYGAYGRPDVVYPGGGYGYGHGYGGHASGGRDARRIDWCRANYRSYDPGSGYYRAYSGRLVWCG